MKGQRTRGQEDDVCDHVYVCVLRSDMLESDQFLKAT